MAADASGWIGDPDAYRCLRLIAPRGSVVELRVMVPTGMGRNAIASGYFDDPVKLVAAAARLDATASGIYITLNSVNAALLARANNRVVHGPKSTTSDSDITGRRFLLVDIDAVRPSGISADDAEKAAALAVAQEIKVYLRSRGFAEPIDCDSGNGGHLLYAIDLPASDGGLIEPFLKALAFLFDTQQAKVDTGVHNPARLTKLYGSMVRKGDSTPERPHRRSSILQAPEVLVPVAKELLEAVAASLPKDPPRSAPHTTAAYEDFDVDAALGRAGLDVSRRGAWKGGTRWVFKTCPFNSEHIDASAYLLQFPSGALAAGCHHNSCQGKGWKDLREILRLQFPTIGAERKSASHAAAKRQRAEIPPYVAFPVDALPEPVRGFVVACSRSIGCDPAFIALPLLSALAAAIGNAMRIRLKRGWSEPSVIWTLVVSYSGTKKSPAFDVALRAVRDKEELSRREFKPIRKEYVASLRKYERAMQKWKRGQSSEEPPLPPEEPIAVRFLCADTTVEAIAVLLLHQPRGLLLGRDEVSGWLGGFNQYKGGQGGDVAHWLEMHTAAAMIVDRKTGEPRHIHVPRAAVSVAGGIQPKVLGRCLGTEHFEDGMAARFLVAYPPRQAKRWTDAEIHEDVLTEIRNIFDGLYSLEPESVIDGDMVPREVVLTEEGRQSWVKFYNEHGQEQAELTGDLCAAWSKLEAYAARFALVIHCVRWASGELSPSDSVDEQSVAAGVTLVRWFGQEAKRVYAMLGESGEDQDEREMLGLIRARSGIMSVRDWQRIRSHATAEDSEAELDALIAAGMGAWGYSTPGPKGGRPSKEFRLAGHLREPHTPDGDLGGEVSSASVLSEGISSPLTTEASNQADRAREEGSSGQVRSDPEEQVAPPRSDTTDSDNTPDASDPAAVSDCALPANIGSADGDWEEL